MALTQVSTDGIKDTTIATADIADDAVTADKLANSINTEIAANTAKATNATHTGDVTGSGALTIANDAVTGAKIADNAVTSDKLASNISVGELAVTGDVHFNSNTNAGKDVYWDESASELQFNDNTYATFGTGEDLKIYHDGSNAEIDNNTGTLNIRSASDVRFKVANTESGVNILANSAVELYHNDVKQFETTSVGISTPGYLYLTGDGKEIRLGAGEDLKIYHNGTDNFIKNENGAFKLLMGAEYALTATANGSVELYYDDSKKLSTNSTGVKIESSANTTFHLTSSTSSSASIEFGDTDDDDEAEIWYDNYSKKLCFRTTEASDLVFYRNGTEKNRITSDGLTFNGDTAAANALNDYETGTFTPLLVGYWSGSWRTTTRDGNMYATYTKVGRLCHVQVYFNAYQITGNGVGTSAAIWDLPFTAAGNSTYGILNVSHSNAFSNCNAGNFYVSQGQSYALSSQYGDNDYDYCTWSGDDTRYLMFSGTYETQ